MQVLRFSLWVMGVALSKTQSMGHKTTVTFLSAQVLRYIHDLQLLRRLCMEFPQYLEEELWIKV